MIRPRSTRIILFTLAAVLVIMLGGAAIYRTAGIDLLGFYLAARRIGDRTAAILEKARVFDEKTALKALGESAQNGFFYRFDDHLDEASSESRPAGPPAGEGGNIFSIEFAGDDAVELRPEQGEFAVREGILEWVYRRGAHLQHEGQLSRSKDDIGEVEIRLKVKEGSQAEFFWSKNRSATILDWHQLGEIAVSTIPDNEFHVYRINAANALKDNLNYGDSIAKIFFVPSDVDGDEVALDYIRFVPRKEKYARTPSGVTHETLNREMRRVIYVNTPQNLGFRISLPEDNPVLDFGMGILENADPVTFRVTVDSREVFSQRVAESEEWLEGRVDLGEWAGKSVEIGLGTESGKGNIAFWSNPLVHTPPRERFNVIIVLEDALRADYLSSWGFRNGITPVKDGFAASGVCFLNAFSQATKTRPSCPSIMTSLYPTATGVWEFTETLPESYLTLAEILRSQGFATAAFIQNDNAGPSAGLHQGFSHLFDPGILGRKTEGIYGDELYGWLAEHGDRNIFLYLHLMDPHGPYDPPPPFDARYREAPPAGTRVPRDTVLHDPEWLEEPTIESRRLLYEGEVRHNDFRFGEFLNKLPEFLPSDDTLIVFISDHGEHLGEHHLWEHRPPGFIQVLHVPLIMVCPGRLPGGVRIDQPVQLLDVMPTILELAGIDQSGLLIQGESLVSLFRGKPPAFRGKRVAVSEEVVFKEKDDTAELASVFFSCRHFINSDRFPDPAAATAEQPAGRKKRPIEGRGFNYRKDREETQPLEGSFHSWFNRRWIKPWVRELQGQGREIRNLLAGNRDDEIVSDPEARERLRDLGYLH